MKFIIKPYTQVKEAESHLTLEYDNRSGKLCIIDKEKNTKLGGMIQQCETDDLFKFMAEFYERQESIARDRL